jgi:glycosyltransferase involved in cell wall biosynthesis
MKILIHHRIASRDGQAVHLEEMIEALRGQGHELLLVGPVAFEQTGFGSSSAAIDWIKRIIPAPIYELMEIGYNLFAFRRLNKAVRQFRPDFIYERFSLFLLAGIWVHRLRRIPLLLEVNGPLFEERVRHDGLSMRTWARACQSYIWRNVTYALPVTGVLAEQVRGYGVPKERIAVIPNGINPERFGSAPPTTVAKQVAGLGGRLVLGFTGFVRAWHAMDKVIEFLADEGERLNLHLLIVGDGPSRQDLERLAESRGVSHRFTITGVVDRDAIANHVATFDVALIPGINDYASPLKMFEYMYMGKAIVAPNQPNIREILEDRRDALLFDPSDHKAMTAAIQQLSEDGALRRQIGDQAQATISEKKLYWSHNASTVVELANTALARAKAEYADLMKAGGKA